MIKVSVVDDHKLFRESLVMLVDSFDTVEVIMQAGDGADFFEQLAETKIQPEIVLLDIQMPKMNGYEVCEKLQVEYPDMKVIIVSQLTTRESIHKIMELGAHGFFTKNSDPDELEVIIKTIKEQEFYLGKDLRAALKELLANDETSEEELVQISLSERELEIIKLAAQEYNSMQIGDVLNIHSRTVDTHRKRIMTKTKCKNFIGVIVYALKNSFLSLEEI